MRKLAAALPEIVWVENQSEALDTLGRGEAAFAMGYSGRAFRKIIAGDLMAMWDVHIYDFTSWAISAQSSNPKLAASFITLATSPNYLAAHARLWPYGPMRRSAVEMVGQHDILNIPLESYLPTSRQRIERGIRHDAAFWAKHSAILNDRLNALLEGFPLGLRVPPPVRRPASIAMYDNGGEAVSTDTN